MVDLLALRHAVPRRPVIRTNRTGALTPRSIAVSSIRVRSASAAAALVFEARRDIHGRAEIVEHIPRRDGDAGSGMKAELQHDGGRACASGGVEACDIVLDRERRTDCVIGA